MKKIVLLGAIVFGILNFGVIANAEVLPIVHLHDVDNQLLRSENHQVEVFDTELHKLIEDMKDTMTAEGGCGLAAPQIGKNLTVFVAQLDNGFQEFINPEILNKSEEQTINIEGCLSIQNLIGIVKRPNIVKIKAFNKNGEEFTVEFMGFDARIVSHEFDHLNKVLYTDIAESVIDTTKLDVSQVKSKILQILREIMQFSLGES